MPTRSHLPAKLTRPRLPRVCARPRLFGMLDRALRARVGWVEGPPGAGKTTLALSWLASRGRPCLWYQVDAGDADVATFHHYLGVAARHLAPRFRRRLPHLTAEFLEDRETFARRYFEELFRRVPERGVIVFDNLQEAGAEGPFHEALRVACESTPAHVKILCLSRRAPPAALARLRANGELVHLGPEAVRLSLEETRALARLRGARGGVARLHARTAGWAAGVVLMLDQRAPLDLSPAAGTPQALFDYFAGEVWRTLDQARRIALMRSALLPRLPVSELAALIRFQAIGSVLAELAGRNYFTYRLSGASPTYEFHPLFREFLLGNAARAFSAGEISALKRQAVVVLEASGRAEEAIALAVEASDWSAAARLLSEHARPLVAEGRAGLLEEWLKALPSRVVDRSPWLLHWLGVCRMPFDPRASRGFLERAFELFEARKDLEGALTTWSSIVDTFAYEWADFRPLDRWIAAIERLLCERPTFPSPEVEERVAAGVFSALTWRRPLHPELPKWAGRVMEIVLRGSDLRLRVTLGHSLLFCCMWSADAVKATAIMSSLRAAKPATRGDPLTQVTWCAMEAMYRWLMGDHPRCIAAVQTGTQLARRTGVHLMSGFLLSMGIESSMAHGHRAATEEYLRALAERSNTRPMDRLHLLYLSAAAASLRGDVDGSIQHGEEALRLADGTGSWLVEAVCSLGLAASLLDAGRPARAEGLLRRAAEAGRGQKMIELLCALHSARLTLEGGAEERGLELLRQALRLGAGQGSDLFDLFLSFTRWSSPVMARLCAKALEHGIETDYVRRLIGLRRLTPPTDALADVERWPWPLKVQSLGRFALYRDGGQLSSSGKVQRRPLALLKMLIALGGRGASEARLADSLWPEAEGDTARTNLRPAIHRLRKLIGPDVLRTEGGWLSLDPARCWVDLWAVEQRLDALERASGAMDPRSLGEATERLFALCGGQFLPGDDLAEAIPVRTRLELRLTRHVLAAGERLQRAGAWAEAISLYEQGLALLPQVEPMHRGLMQCHAALSQPGEVLRAYERCAANLKAQFDIEPSAETRALATRARAAAPRA